MGGKYMEIPSLGAPKRVGSGRSRRYGITSPSDARVSFRVGRCGNYVSGFSCIATMTPGRRGAL